MHEFEDDPAIAAVLLEAAYAAVRRGINQTSRPTRLFHFTDAVGVIGIVRSGTIWASAASSSNDADEAEYGIALARQMLKGREIKAPSSFLDVVEGMLDPSRAPEAGGLKWTSFVAAFCETTESALHWLHYGRSGTGVALALSTDRLTVAPFDLHPVIYDLDTQKSRISSIVTETLTALGQVSREQILNWTMLSAHMAAQAITALAAQLKAPAFETEQEWRIVTHEIKGLEIPAHMNLPDSPTRVRASGSRLIAYKEATYSPLPLTEIILGAACSATPDDYAWNEVAAGVPVRRSRVPVRP